MNIFRYLDSNSAEFFSEGFKVFFWDVVISDKTDKSSWFGFSFGSAAITGVEFTDSNFSSSFEEFSLVVFVDSLEVVLFHFWVVKSEVEVDVEWSEEDFVFEVSFLIECFSFFMINELDFDDSIFAVDWVLFDLGFFFSVFQKHINHFLLNGFLHVLDNQFFAILDLLLNYLLSDHLLKIYSAN